MNSDTLNASLKRAGFGGILVTHDLRSSASIALNKQGFTLYVIEAAQAYVDKNEVRRIYNRSYHHEECHPIMQWRANFVQAAGRSSLDECRYKDIQLQVLA